MHRPAPRALRQADPDPAVIVRSREAGPAPPGHLDAAAIMRVPFTKMHGLSNDFVVLDARGDPLPELEPRVAAALADRREGIGCDQVILLEKSESADFRMRIFNSDGGEVGACGNASRAVALLHGAPARVETAGGTIALEPSDGGASVDMGVPRFECDANPLDYPMDTLRMPVGWVSLPRTCSTPRNL